MIDLMLPTASQASSFATLLIAGLPSEDAIKYFLPDDPTGDQWTHGSIMAIHDRWVSSPRVREAYNALIGKPWESMTLDERIKFSIDKHYGEMAYFLYSHHYSTTSGADKTKADTCRTALEAKLAGLAGKLDPMTRFWEDLTSGRVKLNPTPTSLPA